MLSVTRSQQFEAGQRFERQALALHNHLYHPGHWSARFTQDEINGWLATELPAKFSHLLPAGLCEPRIMIERGAVHFAARYQEGNDVAIVSASARAFLTEVP